MLNVEAAREELKKKSLYEIHEETAWKWASRAAAAFESSTALSGIDKSLVFNEAMDYLGEAKEHAAQVGAGLVERVTTATGKYVMDAVVSLDQSFKGDKNA